ncbi:MAG: toll/interleukin-1 receptor domain-containing protein [Bacteroidetes bacterium]|nr:toll/interleukin-1 receptor domain-containing protein [Bacteroidota bacterium]
MARTKLFIGHANPEDNEFTLWLCAKLRNEGYDAICDLTLLIGGEQDYWKTLQDVLENESCKYLLIFTKDTFAKQGVIDEWEQVRSIQRKNNIKDFMYILKKDDVPFNERIGINVYNHFRFDISWASGLKNIIKKLDIDSTPKTLNKNLSLNDWVKNRFANNSGVIEKSELFYSNWLQISEHPKELFIYRYSNSAQAETILKEINVFPAIRHDKYIITFLNEVPKYSTEFNYAVVYKEKLVVDISDFYQLIDRTEFPKIGDIKRFVVRLFNEAFDKFLIGRGLNVYMMSQKKKCYYYIAGQIPKNKISFEYLGKMTRRNIIGEYDHDHFWHFGISFSSILNPFKSYFLKTHLLFSSDAVNIWDSKSKLHSARRKKGKSFYNSAWRNLLFAFLMTLSDDGKSIKIPLKENMYLELLTTPMSFTCEYGYNEPPNKGRLVPIDYYEEDIENDLEEEFYDQGQISNGKEENQKFENL